MIPATSAFVIYAPPATRADTQIVQTVLSLSQGSFFQANIPETVTETVLAHILIKPKTE